MTSLGWRPAARYGVPGLLTVQALAWVLESGRVPLPEPKSWRLRPPGRSPSPPGGTGSTQLLYLIDTRSQALAIYRVDPQNHKGTLKLEATRHYRWDLKLGEFNNQPPEVAAVESMVGQLRP